ncbi:MAG: DUF4286 family protein [Flavobacteriales bacterium]|jgi:hypothetical protein|nr:DUF4286 family protein [Flavobacteriales bacterium]
MILYNVTISIDLDAHDDWLAWMKEVHIPDMLATGLFTAAHLHRVLADDDGGLTYAVQYHAPDMAHYERYRDTHATRLQGEAEARFGGRFMAFRTLLERIHDDGPRP